MCFQQLNFKNKFASKKIIGLCKTNLQLKSWLPAFILGTYKPQFPHSFKITCLTCSFQFDTSFPSHTHVFFMKKEERQTMGRPKYTRGTRDAESGETSLFQRREKSWVLHLEVRWWWPEHIKFKMPGSKIHHLFLMKRCIFSENLALHQEMCSRSDKPKHTHTGWTGNPTPDAVSFEAWRVHSEHLPSRNHPLPECGELGAMGDVCPCPCAHYIYIYIFLLLFHLLMVQVDLYQFGAYRSLNLAFLMGSLKVGFKWNAI